MVRSAVQLLLNTPIIHVELTPGDQAVVVCILLETGHVTHEGPITAGVIVHVPPQGSALD